MSESRIEEANRAVRFYEDSVGLETVKMSNTRSVCHQKDPSPMHLGNKRLRCIRWFFCCESEFICQIDLRYRHAVMALGKPHGS